jgi:hypothetical protein
MARAWASWNFAILGVFSVLVSGCASGPDKTFRWPWSRSNVLAEEYAVPPLNDYRYSSSPKLPKSVTQPGLKTQASDPRRTPPAGMGGAPPGMMMPGAQPGGRPGAWY